MQHSLRFPLIIAFATIALALFAPNRSHAATITVTLTDNQFTPRNITINAGDTIRWVNNGQMVHTVTADSGVFDSGSIQPGQSYSLMFNQPGTYAYYCRPHGGPGGQGMSGVITVVAGGAQTTTQTGSTDTALSLQAEAAALLARVQQLQQQLAAQQQVQSGSQIPAPISGAANESCPRIGRTLKRGSSGDDVSRLQQYLARDPSIYPEGQVTGYYGALTEAAVRRWQSKYNIVSSGTPESTGYGVVGPRTAAAISLQCANGGGGPTGTTPTVGGFFQVTPVSGAAPLSVTVTATVNTVNSCAAATYGLQWGDIAATQLIQVPAGACNQIQQTLTHTYVAPGTYTIRLSAGPHQTTATVVVSGQAQSTTTPSNLPEETFNANPKTGAAPLKVTFTGTVTGADKGWCAAGCSSTLDFGDGTTGQVPLPLSQNSSQSYSIEHTYTTPGVYAATLYQGAKASGRPTVGSSIGIIVTGATQGDPGDPNDDFDYGPMGVIPGTGGNASAVTVQFELPSACTGYSLSWGDGSANAVQNHSNSCSQTAVMKNLAHTYQSSGSFTITLRRGPSLSQVDSASIVIQN